MQSAYEVLSDPQERAWYDRHRDAILRNQNDVSGEHDEHTVRVTTAEDIVKYFTNFRRNLDFTDSDTGFYTVLRRKFDDLVREEELACEWEGFDPITYPSFGHAEDPYDDVVRPFYSAWNSFVTKKSFSWKDVYCYSEAPDRRIRRIMEKENKRFREEGAREFNDAVRSLVAFVKKRDPRFKPNTQSEAERQKQLRDTTIAQAFRSRAANHGQQPRQEAMPGWMQSSEPHEFEISDESEEIIQEQFECVVCKKSFKSEKQYEAHEKSKKHVRSVQHVKRQTQQAYKQSRFEGLNDMDPPHLDSDGIEGSKEVDVFTETEVAVERKGNFGPSDGASDQQYETGGPDSCKASPRTSSSDNTLDRVAADQLPRNVSSDEYIRDKGQEKRVLSNPEDAVHGAIENFSGKLASSSWSQDNDINAQPRTGKAKGKRARRAAQKLAASAGSDADFKCRACQAGFPSKTRLFSHIAELGHAQPIFKSANWKIGKNDEIRILENRPN